MTGGSSRKRKRILRTYYLHPIKDRERIRRWLPKLYLAWARREGWAWVYGILGGWVPAMRITEYGIPPDVQKHTGPNWLGFLAQGTRRKWEYSGSPAQKRARERAKRRRAL